MVQEHPRESCICSARKCARNCCCAVCSLPFAPLAVCSECAVPLSNLVQALVQPPCPRLVGCTVVKMVKEPRVMTQRFTQVNSSQNLRRRARCNRCISLAQTNKTRTKPASAKRYKKSQDVSSLKVVSTDSTATTECGKSFKT